MTEPSPAPSALAPDLGHELLARFRSGDLDALGAVFDRYSGGAMTVIRSVLRDEAQAEDALQETFLKAWRAAGTFDPQRAIGPWLFTIARRTAIDVVRREGRPTRSDHDELTEDLAVAGSVDAPGLESAWEAWQVRTALDQLPEEERLVMQLSHYGGLTQPQIADRLGIPAGTVKSRSHRAHRRLVALLGHLIDDEGRGGDVP